MDLGLRGAAALVSAASEGLGRAIAERFAAEGADVALCARREQPLRAAEVAVAAHGTRVLARPVDVTDAAAVTALVDEAAAHFGRLDHLVVNAGGPPPGTFDDLDDDAWLRGHELTVMSAVRLIRAARPHLERSPQGSVTIVSSHTVRHPVPNLLLSNSLRLSVVGLAKSLSEHLAPHVRVNTVLPGRIATARNRALAERTAEQTGSSVEAVVRRNTAEIPLGRIGDPAEFAAVTVFLASPAASYVTGQVLSVDGGLVRTPI